jgi:hypothetical protein
VAQLYTKDGEPLEVGGNDIWDRNGRHVGRRRGKKVFGPNGRYAGTIDGDRVIYRSIDSAEISSPFAPSPRVGSAEANAIGSALWG